MKEIDVLLAKYLAGESSLSEESQLKDLLLNQSDSEYIPYQNLFAGYAALHKMQPSINFDKTLLSKLRYSKQTRFYQNWTFRLASLSVAASIIITVAFISFSQEKEAYFVEKGVRYDDMEKAVGYADEAFNQALAPLKQSMQSLEPIRGLEGSLSPSFINNTSIDTNQHAAVIAFDSMMKSRY